MYEERGRTPVERGASKKYLLSRHLASKTYRRTVTATCARRERARVGAAVAVCECACYLFIIRAREEPRYNRGVHSDSPKSNSQNRTHSSIAGSTIATPLGPRRGAAGAPPPRGHAVGRASAAPLAPSLLAPVGPRAPTTTTLRAMYRSCSCLALYHRHRAIPELVSSHQLP